MFQISDWIPALTTTSLLSLALWLAKSLIATRLKSSVQSEFDKKLEVLRSELKSKEAQIESLRSGAMSGLITRQGALYQRKLEAIDQIWKSLKELEKAKYISSTLASLKFEECAKESVKNPQFRSFIETIGGNFDITKLDLEGAILARPFITPIAWAYYSAYSSVIMSAYTRMQILKIGVDDAEKFLNSDHTDKLLKTVLPLNADYIDQHGYAGHHYLLDQIENLLLAELKNIQDGHGTDKENTKRAAEITKEVEKLKSELAEFQANALSAIRKRVPNSLRSNMAHVYSRLKRALDFSGGSHENRRRICENRLFLAS
ncbi:hypothetical protein [Motilimonas pumila]|uniref:Uncharacterized protein n=1 Tax=Motilimonas pumila TaxID=2303987 RepID=A0A418Y9B0_9GAMM|nr:hypothetical protein [Motilimonas pumila]RJG36913.1 hypothetical protein D1Z90_20130 [Motilimonas pumila]